MTAAAPGPRVLVTGFGPFPGAPENPSAALVLALATHDPADLGAAALHAVVLPTDYRKSWQRLSRLVLRLHPDVVVHFGLSRSALEIHVEGRACRRIDRTKLDAAGFAPRRGYAARYGPEHVAASLDPEPILWALQEAGFPAARSADAGGYVCNATFYRSLLGAGGERLVGFLHVPPLGAGGYTAARLVAAAMVVIRTAVGQSRSHPARKG